MVHIYVWFRYMCGSLYLCGSDMCGSDICVVHYMCGSDICVRGRLRYCDEICLPALCPSCPPTIFPFYICKTTSSSPLSLHLCQNTKKHICLIKSLIFYTWTFVPTVNLLKLIHSVNFEQWPQIHPLFLPVVC